jgi:hypothetical protein
MTKLIKHFINPFPHIPNRKYLVVREVTANAANFIAAYNTIL